MSLHKYCSYLQAFWDQFLKPDRSDTKTNPSKFYLQYHFLCELLILKAKRQQKSCSYSLKIKQPHKISAPELPF